MKKKIKDILPGGIVMPASLKKLRDTDYMEFIRIYQSMLIELKSMEASPW